MKRWREKWKELCFCYVAENLFFYFDSGQEIYKLSYFLSSMTQRNAFSIPTFLCPNHILYFPNLESGENLFLDSLHMVLANTNIFSPESVTESDESTPVGSPTDDRVAGLERSAGNFIASARARPTKKGRPTKRIEIPATTPTRAITAITSTLWEDLVSNPKKENQGDFFNRKKVQHAEKIIRGAFVELYRGLGLLKTYRYCA